eukprot:CAMPEP_0172467314 /NCGR_PEP_ID=MMETSP1065-20121228/58534_1 /TAXON_ID=265537 /ORGANISM="Amphiprora paludosa, Strain CCMP125" /LENGTH=192 /DNA_ID=CAMNT_0013224421 /DNA_START=37 /DNA_END=612 /DNA_ORIENTATION=+
MEMQQLPLLPYYSSSSAGELSKLPKRTPPASSLVQQSGGSTSNPPPDSSVFLNDFLLRKASLLRANSAPPFQEGNLAQPQGLVAKEMIHMQRQSLVFQSVPTAADLVSFLENEDGEEPRDSSCLEDSSEPPTSSSSSSFSTGDGDGRFLPHQQGKWYEMLQHLKRFKKEHGHCAVPYVYKPNRRLGHWVRRN